MTQTVIFRCGDSGFSVAGYREYRLRCSLDHSLVEELPSATRSSRFDFSRTRNADRFAAGMSGIVAFR